VKEERKFGSTETFELILQGMVNRSERHQDGLKDQHDKNQ